MVRWRQTRRHREKLGNRVEMKSSSHLRTLRPTTLIAAAVVAVVVFARVYADAGNADAAARDDAG